MCEIVEMVQFAKKECSRYGCIYVDRFVLLRHWMCVTLKKEVFRWIDMDAVTSILVSSSFYHLMCVLVVIMHVCIVV